MSIPNPNPNIADGMKCDNKTYSSNKIEEMVQGASGPDTRIPDATVADIGKVLGIVSDGLSGAEYEAVSVEGNDPRLPDATDVNIGKVLGIVSNGASGAKYGAVSLPSPTPTIREITLTLGAYDTAQDYGEVTCDKTTSQIKNYIDAGDVLHIKDTDGYYYSVSEVYESHGSSRISFLGARYESNTIVMYLISLADGEYTKRSLTT